MELCEQRFDPRRVRDALIELERDLRCYSQSERAANARAEMRSRAREPIESRGALGVASENADEDLGVPKVTRDVDAGHRHETDDARILDAFGKECRHFFTNRFGNPVRATGVMCHMSLPSFARPEDRAHGRAGRVGRSQPPKGSRRRGKE